MPSDHSHKKSAANPEPKLTLAHFRHWIFAFAAVVLVIVAASLAGSNYQMHHKPVIAASSAHFLYKDAKNAKLILTDNTGKQISSSSYQKAASVNYESATPSGQVLLSLNNASQDQSFLFINQKVSAVNPETAKILRLSPLIGDSRHIVFLNDTHAALVACSATCKLVNLDFSTGKYTTILDTGVALGTGDTAYLLGASPDNTSVYLRTLGSNKLGKELNAVYMVSLTTHKVTQTISLPVDAGYTPALSADASKIAYAAGGFNLPVTIHVVDLASSKDSSYDWAKVTMPNQTNALKWSPDSQKIFFHTAYIVQADDSQQQSASVKMDYLDTTNGKITELTSITDPAHHDLTFHDWFDDKTTIYASADLAQDYNFSSAVAKTYKQDIVSKHTTQASGPGQLVQVVRW